MDSLDCFCEVVTSGSGSPTIRLLCQNILVGGATNSVGSSGLSTTKVRRGDGATTKVRRDDSGLRLCLRLLVDGDCVGCGVASVELAAVGDPADPRQLEVLTIALESFLRLSALGGVLGAGGDSLVGRQRLVDGSIDDRVVVGEVTPLAVDLDWRWPRGGDRLRVVFAVVGGALVAVLLTRFRRERAGLLDVHAVGASVGVVLETVAPDTLEGLVHLKALGLVVNRSSLDDRAGLDVLGWVKAREQKPSVGGAKKALEYTCVRPGGWSRVRAGLGHRARSWRDVASAVAGGSRVNDTVSGGVGLGFDFAAGSSWAWHDLLDDIEVRDILGKWRGAAVGEEVAVERGLDWSEAWRELRGGGDLRSEGHDSCVQWLADDEWSV